MASEELDSALKREVALFRDALRSGEAGRSGQVRNRASSCKKLLCKCYEFSFVLTIKHNRWKYAWSVEVADYTPVFIHVVVT